MLITDKQFFTEELDFSIPELAEARDLYLAGKAEDAEHAFAEYLRGSLNPEHYFELGRHVGQGRSVQDLEYDIFENANRICRGIVRSCSYTYDFGGDIIWDFNGTPDGYREWHWQLNRHHIFKIIAYAYLETGDEKYAEGFNKHMSSWLDQAICPGWPVPNRCAKYPMWRTITAGIRMHQNWPYAIHAFINSPSIPDKTWVRIAMSLWEHGQFLMNSPSSLNWLDIEMSGLNAIGCIFPFFKNSKVWRNFAVDMMIKEIKTQVYPDGFQCELTTGYQETVISTALSVYKIAKHYGVEVDEDYTRGIQLLYTIYPKLMRPDGKTPITNDGSHVDVMGKMRHLLENFPDNQYAKDILDGKISEIYPLDVVMPYSGMITMRTGWGENDMWIFFESAPFGAGHQHDDKLNINLSAYGKNILNVLGNFAYDGSPMRNLHVNTRGHNTGLVDDKGQNARPTHTQWSDEKVSQKSDLEVNVGGDIVVAYGKYNRGYGKELIPVTHERKVVFFREGLDGSLPFAVLLDKFTTEDEKPHKYELSFPLYDVPVTLNGRHVTVHAGDGVTLEMVTHAALATTTAANGPEYMGWRAADSRLAKEHLPAPVIRIYDYAETKNFATVLYPTPDGKAPEIGINCDEEKFTLTLDGKDYTFSYDDERLKTEQV